MSYTIGIDYGTQSARALLVEVGTGHIAAEAERAYPHGVMTRTLPNGSPLGHDWALQDGNDYYVMLTQCVRELVERSGVSPKAVIGIGIDTTCCSILPLDGRMEPLSSDSKWSSSPHAYLKLWKHHAAQEQANRVTALAKTQGRPFISRYGGRISSEWMIPKVLQVAEEAPELYEAAHSFAEVGDWLVGKLCGTMVRSNVMAGYKALYHSKEGYPDEGFFAALNPIIKNVVRDKFSQPIQRIGERAGMLTPRAAEDLGLTTSTAVAVAHTDACIVPAGIGMDAAGQMAMSIGTSTCHLLLADREVTVPGICGVVQDGTIPGFYSYEAGQAAVGDCFDWFARHCAGEAVYQQAREQDLDIFALLERQAAALKPGESGLVALDWFNGNRTILVDADLSSLIMGLTLQTRPHEIYRALLESTAFGTRVIIENFEEHGVPVKELFACGGIPSKSPLMMQIYADVCKREIKVSSLSLASSYSGALYGAVAAGGKAGGYDSVHEAVKAMAWKETKTYVPDTRAGAIYDELFTIFMRLHDFAGVQSDVMKRLKKLRG